MAAFATCALPYQAEKLLMEIVWRCSLVKRGAKSLWKHIQCMKWIYAHCCGIFQSQSIEKWMKKVFLLKLHIQLAVSSSLDSPEGKEKYSNETHKFFGDHGFMFVHYPVAGVSFCYHYQSWICVHFMLERPSSHLRPKAYVGVRLFCIKVHSLFFPFPRSFVKHHQPHEKIDKKVVNARNSFRPRHIHYRTQNFFIALDGLCFRLVSLFSERYSVGGWLINLWKPSTISRLMESRILSLSITFLLCAEHIVYRDGKEKQRKEDDIKASRSGSEQRKKVPNRDFRERNFRLSTDHTICGMHIEY